jgi:hypothetical protein
MRKARQERVEEAIDKLRAFHDLGRLSLRRRPGPAKQHDRAIDREAAELGIGGDTLRKARQFAAGYTARDLKELCRAIRAAQVTQDDASPIIGTSHIIRLLTVASPRDRVALLSEAIEHAWSVIDLNIELAKRFGLRGAGGRAPRVARDRERFYVQVEHRCESWRRWHDKVYPPDQPGRCVVTRGLPKEMDEKLHEVAKLLG